MTGSSLSKCNIVIIIQHHNLDQYRCNNQIRRQNTEIRFQESEELTKIKANRLSIGARSVER